jgi:protein gp37
MSKIEWTEEVWNPIVGCSVISPGCTNCYAMRDAWRKGFNPKTPQYHGLTRSVNDKPVWTGEVRLVDIALLKPLRRKAPTMYFVNSMSDLFHEEVPDAWIDKVFAVMALSPQHTFQVLTKRAKRMREYFVSGREALHTRWLWAGRDMLGCYAGGVINGVWPLPNVWLGVSTERQQEADVRIPELLATPAAIRFVSAEPLLGPIDLYNGDPDPRLGGHKATHTFLGDWWQPGDNPKGPSRHGVDWVIVGGESGPGARPMHPDWPRSLRDQCAAAGVPFFFKQWGEWAPEPEWYADHRTSLACTVWDGKSWTDDGAIDGEWLVRVGKRRAGRLLDGGTHDAMPECTR